MNLTPLQWFGMASVILGVLAGGTAQLTEIFGPTETKVIVACAGLLNSMVGGFIMALGGQSGLVRAVNDMPGVSKIEVNASANQALATIAVDPSSKVEATPEAAKIVEATAKGTGT